VNVVGHEAIGEDAEAGVRVKLAEEVEVEGVVTVVEEDLLAAVAALGDVVGDVWEDDSGDAGHMEDELAGMGIVLGNCV
jgi:hypothetical protein